jgi:hypothetical protein
MSDREGINQHIHDLLGEAHMLFISMSLPGPIDTAEVTDLVARVRRGADEAREIGKDTSAKQLHDAADLIENRLTSRR